MRMGERQLFSCSSPKELVVLAALVFLLGCQNDKPAINAAELDSLVKQLLEKSQDNMVFIEGGTFLMGDFGAVGEDGIWRPYFPPTAERNKAHEVILSSYSLSSQKTTWADYDTYLLAEGLEVFERNYQDRWEREPFDKDPSSRFYVEKPARVTWQEARDYCQWLGDEKGLVMDLPTSAQWEFAGRNRGSKEWIFPTHDGKHRESDFELSTRLRDMGEYVPVGSRLPPNPLGIYDMSDNGREWVSDWFSDSWYQESNGITDPQGPEQGEYRTVRNHDFSFSRSGVPESVPSGFSDEWELIITHTFRCAVQSHEAVSEEKL